VDYNRLQIRFTVESWILKKWQSCCTCRKNNTIQQFIILFIIYNTQRVSWIMVKALVTSNIIQSVCLVGKGQLKERCGLEPRTNFFFRLRNQQILVRIRFEKIRYILYSHSTILEITCFSWNWKDQYHVLKTTLLIISAHILRQQFCNT
jgi:hypothetical protein